MLIVWDVDRSSRVVVCAASSFWHGPIFQSSEHTCVILSFRDEAIHLSSRNSVEPKKHQAIHNAMSRMINGGTLQSNIHIDSDLKNTLHNWWMIYHLSTADARLLLNLFLNFKACLSLIFEKSLKIAFTNCTSFVNDDNLFIRTLIGPGWGLNSLG